MWVDLTASAWAGSGSERACRLERVHQRWRNVGASLQDGCHVIVQLCLVVLLAEDQDSLFWSLLVRDSLSILLLESINRNTDECGVRG
mmetsp:Transcript_18288/g.42329  ORF Transcript_18288/g.42329 Transcript_18288/m.42329 type:complete len:88 (-) Transcript_18288:610-873(-)